MKKKLIPSFLALGLIGLSVFISVAFYPKNKDLNQSYSGEQTCASDIADQRNAIKNDPLAKIETFQAHKVTDIFQGTLADLDTTTNDIYIRTFRTRIQEELKNTGINFAGHYSLIQVGITGGPNNYYIVDRINGKADIFPYASFFLEFRKDSNLIIINPGGEILGIMPSILSAKEDIWGYCNQMGSYYYLPDLRPFYVTWDNITNTDTGSFYPLGRHTPPINEFWSAKGIFR